MNKKKKNAYKTYLFEDLLTFFKHVNLGSVVFSINDEIGIMIQV